MTRWVLLVSVVGLSFGACGDDDPNGQLADAPSSTIDARVNDAPIDAPPEPGTDAAIDAAIDGPPAAVIVTVTLGGRPLRDQVVYFQSRDSATTVTLATGEDGNATSFVEAGGFVTVIKPEAPIPGARAAIGNNTQLATFAGVQPGDHLFVDVPLSQGLQEAVTFTINVPNEEQGYNYTLHSSCGSAFIGRGNSPARGRKAAAVAVPVSNEITLFGCGGTADLLVLGDDGKGGLQSWLYKADEPLTEGGTVNLAGPYEPVDRQDFTYTIRDNTFAVDLTRELRTARGVLFTVSDRVNFDGSTGSTTIALPVPTNVLAVTKSTPQMSDGFSRPSVIDWGLIRSYELDLTVPGLLPPYDGNPTFDVASRAITWPQDAAGVAPQLTVGRVATTRPNDGSSDTWTWELVGPYVAGTLTYPVLPTTLFDFNPRDTDEVFIERLTTAQVPGGYDAARPRMFAGDLTGAVAGATGRIVLEDMNPPVNPKLNQIRRTLRRLGFTLPAR